ncbi:uncharacterized protein LOC103706984 [Phoenix dactylifera]|uniref:Uncharacterized protein LOC103706984 n=1 Tax=Phoenix dactylifera TaxID=42345 RepID=A0A8B7C122_PHODC|nr:uncharacterized protein LOC103706984 [Phoenix dactylifera]
MDSMDTNLVSEVPETTDRLMIVRPVDGSSGPSTRGVNIVERFNTIHSDQRIAPATTKHAPCPRGSGLVDVPGSTTVRDNAEHLFTEARLGQLSSKINETRPSPQVQASRVEFEENMACNYSSHGAKTVELGSRNPFPPSHPSRHRDSRKDGKRLFVESENGGCSGLSIGRQQNGVGFSWKLPVSTSKEERCRENGKGTHLSSDLQVGTDKIPSKSSQLAGCQRNAVQRRPIRNGYSSSHDMTKSDAPSEVDDRNVMNSLHGTAYSLLPGISNQVSVKGRDVHDASQFKTSQSLQRWSQFGDDSPRNTGRRKLVHNGCISASNVAKGKAVAKNDDDGNMVSNELFDGVSPRQVHIVSPDSEGGCADKRKGKVILDNNVAPNMQEKEAKPQAGRACSMGGNGVTVIADFGDDTLRSPKRIGWRTRLVHIEEASISSFGEGSSASKREDTSILPGQNHEIATVDGDFINLLHDSPEIVSMHHGSTPNPLSITSELESETGTHYRRRKRIKGKRKCGLVHSHFGECSSTTLEDSEILYIQSSRQTSNTKSTRAHNSQVHDTFMQPVIEVDEPNSPEVRYSKPQGESCGVFDDSSARNRQVESDEILARQLQEQFYHELQEFGDLEEIDATIAWSLQQEEDAQNAASIGRQGQPLSRETSIADLYAQNPRALFRNVSAQSTNLARVPASTRVAQLRRNFNGPEMDLEMRMISELRRSFTSAEMDFETRLNFLEALEAAFEDSHDMEDDFPPILHHFDEDDFEMLFAVDDNSHQHAGASESQIDSLPQSVIQSDSIKEACAICLEVPSTGDVIRHLPCLHKFHKECIDTWLKRRTLCPICKCGITLAADT